MIYFAADGILKKRSRKDLPGVTYINRNYGGKNLRF
jgi:hypothetical protein